MPEEVGVKEMEQGPEGRSVSYSGGSWEEMFLSPEFDETLQGLPSAIGGLIDTPSLVTSAWGVAWLWHHDRITQPRIPPHTEFFAVSLFVSLFPSSIPSGGWMGLLSLSLFLFPARSGCLLSLA